MTEDERSKRKSMIRMCLDMGGVCADVVNNTPLFREVKTEWDRWNALTRDEQGVIEHTHPAELIVAEAP